MIYIIRYEHSDEYFTNKAEATAKYNRLARDGELVTFEQHNNIAELIKHERALIAVEIKEHFDEFDNGEQAAKRQSAVQKREP